jgi:hypothetical protein
MEASEDHVVLQLKLWFDAAFAFAKRMSALQRVRTLFISDCNRIELAPRPQGFFLGFCLEGIPLIE